MKEKIRIYKNVLVISLAFLCQFTAFNGIGNLQEWLEKFIICLKLILESSIYIEIYKNTIQ